MRTITYIYDETKPTNKDCLTDCMTPIRQMMVNGKWKVNDMRLIDADALVHELNNSHYPGAPYVDAGISIAIGKVCDAPHIEVRNTGYWLRTGRDNVFGGFEVECSECGDTVMITHIEDELYCRHCGAKMKEGEQE